MGWLRRYGAGSPAPLPDGRVVAITQKGLVTAADPTGKPVGEGFLPYDVSALPDGRLMPACSYNMFYRHCDPRFVGAEPQTDPASTDPGPTEPTPADPSQ